MKHTPGPWAKKDNGDSFHIIGANGDWIATVHGGIEEDEANAQLIAAAPMLAEALLKALENLQAIASQEGDIAYWNDGGNGREACNAARHALAAAGVVS